MFVKFGESALFPDATGAAVRSATVTSVSTQAVKLLVLLKVDLDGLIASGVLNPECVQAIAKVAKTRRLENKLKQRVAQRARA